MREKKAFGGLRIMRVPKKQIEGHCWECPNCGNTNPENWLCCVRCIKDRGKTPLLSLTAKEWESRIWRG